MGQVQGAADHIFTLRPNFTHGGVISPQTDQPSLHTRGGSLEFD
ncbi:hypothetical protein [Actibacterium sp. 188UL27-1]|nr:hypothetical protein [Actibacterium sp. 188UL27-1]